VTINNEVVDGSSVGHTIAGQFGTLTITSFSSTSIGYTYALTTNTSVDTAHDDFVVKVTDTDNQSQTATLTINIVDDVPTANADAGTVTEGATLDVAAASGVLANDVAGADGFAAGGAIVGVAAGSSTSSPVSGQVDTDVAGAHGTLHLYSDGHYTYHSSPDNITENATDTFVYTVKDSDGDLSTTTLTINVNNVSVTATTRMHW